MSPHPGRRRSTPREARVKEGGNWVLTQYNRPFHCVYNTLTAIKTGVLWKLHLSLSYLNLHRKNCLPPGYTFDILKAKCNSIINNISRSLHAVQFKAEGLNQKKKKNHWASRTKQKTIDCGLFSQRVFGKKFVWDFGGQVACQTLKGHISQGWHTADCIIKSPSQAWFVSSGQVKKSLIVSAFQIFLLKLL